MNDTEASIGVIGATSLVGDLIMSDLERRGVPAIPFSRNVQERSNWRDLMRADAFVGVSICVCAAPIWVLLSYLDRMKAAGVHRIVVLSSTSRFTKGDSEDEGEREVVARLVNAETYLTQWCDENDVSYVILRPTLIYGRGRDKNVSEIARFIRRFGFFPLLGGATGLRQPVHAEDVAAACLAGLDAAAGNIVCNIPGGETLAYRDMVRRIFIALGRKPVMFSIPKWCFAAALMPMRLLPRYRKVSSAMVERMNRDLTFDSTEAVSRLRYAPRRFSIAHEDLPPG